MPGYQREEYYQPSKVATGSAASLGTLAERLQEFSNIAIGAYEEVAVPQAEQAGADAAAAGDTDLRAPISAVNRAYNASLVRSYALDAYADVHEKLAQLEIEAGTDSAKFKSSVEGYRSGMLPAMLPAARLVILRALQEREAEGNARIAARKAEETHTEALAQSERGLRVLEDRISRGYTAGTEESVKASDEGLQLYLGHLQGGVEGGLYTESEANAKRDAMFKNVTRNVALGRLEAELGKPGGDPVAVIEGTLKQASPMLSDEENMQLVTDLLQRLNVHQAIAYERTGGSNTQWAAGEKHATQLLLRGQLTLGTLDRMVSDDQLDPAIARSMRSAIKEGGSDVVSDPREEYNVRANLFEYEEIDIRDNPKLSWEDKATLINERRKLEGGWQDSNPAQEAKGRIDRALGLVPGTLIQSLPDEVKTQRGRAMTEWYETVDALPPEQRVAGSVKIADEVIERVITRNNEAEVARLKKMRDDLGKRYKGKELNKAQLDELKRLDERIKKAGG